MEQEVVVELFWYRLGSGEWWASITDAATGTTCEVCRVSELEEVLREILDAQLCRVPNPMGRASVGTEEIEDAATGS